MRQALFAWEGFSFTHPEDWSPVSLTGARAQGYARLQGPGRIGCQVRWQKAPKKLDLDLALDNYFKLLEKDASRAKFKLRTERKLENGQLIYRWVGTTQGRGAILSSDGRLFILEVVGGRSDSLLPISNSIVESFRSLPAEMECWSLFGMHVRLPRGISPISKSLQSGRTWLTFRPKGVTIEAGRYAFGNELVAKHGLEPWARAALNMPHANAETEGHCLVLTAPPKALRPPSKALVRLDVENNQLLIVRSSSKSPKWNPQWEWLDLSDS